MFRDEMKTDEEKIKLQCSVYVKTTDMTAYLCYVCYVCYERGTQ